MGRRIPRLRPSFDVIGPRGNLIEVEIETLKDEEVQDVVCLGLRDILSDDTNTHRTI